MLSSSSGMNPKLWISHFIYCSKMASWLISCAVTQLMCSQDSSGQIPRINYWNSVISPSFHPGIKSYELTVGARNKRKARSYLEYVLSTCKTNRWPKCRNMGAPLMRSWFYLHLINFIHILCPSLYYPRAFFKMDFSFSVKKKKLFNKFLAYIIHSLIPIMNTEF